MSAPNTGRSRDRVDPGFFHALPGPSSATGLPDFIIRRFRVPVFLLPVYQAAGIQYGVRWEVLAAINEIETDYGRNLKVSSAGAEGWMQFLPSTWRIYGVDANNDGVENPDNPVDAIFAAARYLKAAGYERDARRAIFAYNHANWYVDSVLLRARLIAGLPADLVGAMTGLAEARPPVAARARYGDDRDERGARRGIEILARSESPIVAVNDGVIKKIGLSKRLGRYMVLQDVYGNRFTYARVGTIARYHGVRDAGGRLDPAGLQPASTEQPRRARVASTPVKKRLFAHPNHPASRAAGDLEQRLERNTAKGGPGARNGFVPPIELEANDERPKRLEEGAHVTGGTILARFAEPGGQEASRMYFEIRPAGSGATRIDPKPILEGWRLLAETGIYRPSGRNVLRGDGIAIGQLLLLPKRALERRVLGDDRIDIYPCGRKDVRSGEVDRRVLATLAYLAESGLHPTVTSLKCGHSFHTATGNVSHHSSGNAVDISHLNGVPILGNQEPGGVAERTVRRLLVVQGTPAADQIISLLDLGGPAVAMADHADHIHVGFRPRLSANDVLGRQGPALLRAGQWSSLVQRLGSIESPFVPTTSSPHAISPEKQRSSAARSGS